MEDQHGIHLGRTLSMLAVYDGHGGGETARFIRSALHRAILREANPTADLDRLSEIFMKIDAECLDNIRDSGSTACVVLSEPVSGDRNRTRITICNVGDSRCIVLNGDGVIVFASRDHKPTNPIERARIRAAGGTVQYGRVDGSLAVSRSFGDHSYKLNSDLPADRQTVIATPEIDQILVDTRNHKIIVLCDGLLERMSNGDIATLVMNPQLRALASINGQIDPVSILIKLLDTSLHRGSRDNMTAILAETGDGTLYGPMSMYLPEPCTGTDLANERFMRAYIADALANNFRDSADEVLLFATESGYAELASEYCIPKNIREPLLGEKQVFSASSESVHVSIHEDDHIDEDELQQSAMENHVPM
jgi:serine/threonine protein phosphatase PrpC